MKSDFSTQHPEFRWVVRGGKAYHSQLSLAYSEVREYKLSILRELLANYKLVGLFLDWIRTGDVRDNPQNDKDGVADYGYEKPLAGLFKVQFGKPAETVPNGDDSWVRVRAQPQTLFMRGARELARKQNVPLSLMVGHPWHYRGEVNKIDGNLRGLLLDVNTWAKEGLMDSVVAAGYYRDGGNAALAWEALKKETEGKADVWTYAWVPSNVTEVEQSVGTANKVGAKQILFWEADYIDDRANAAELKRAMKKISSG